MGAPARPANRPAGVVPPKSAPAKKRRKLSAKRLALMVAIGIVVLGGLLTLIGYYGFYSPAKQLATDGIHHLQSAEKYFQELPDHPLDEVTIGKARAEFSAAQDDFNGVNTRLTLAGPFLGLYGGLSGRSAEFQSYTSLARMALDLSKAGNQGLGAGLALFDKMKHAFQKPQAGGGLSASDLASAQQTTSSVISLVDDAWNQLPGVTLSSLPDQTAVQEAIALFRNNYPGLRQTLLNYQALLGAAPALFGIGKTTTYLAELLDTDEQRPTGGFITAYGLISFQNGQLGGLSLQDTYVLDTPYQATHNTALPKEDAWFPLTSNWGLRDSNLEPDFPTAAKAAEQLYQAEGGKPVDGVLAITSTFLTHLLSFTGPIQIPELNNVLVNDGSFINQLHQYQFQRSEGSDNVTQNQIDANNTQFPALVAKHLLDVLRALTPDATLAIIEDAIQGMANRDVQFYVNDAKAEANLLKAHLGGAVETPDGDSLLVVDTNIAGNKANAFVTEYFQDSIILDDQGQAIHHLFLTYQWQTQGPVYGSSTYTDYLRIYVPPGSQLQGFSGFSNIDAASAYNRTVWSSTFHLIHGQQVQFTLTYAVPNAVQQQGSGLHYSFLAQRQPGFPFPSLSLIINVPQDTSISTHSPNIGDNLQFPMQNLTRDTSVSVDFG
jgi:hypothetical protein